MKLAKPFRMWWPGTELNRRRQPFQGCGRPSLSTCNPYLYCRSDLYFGRSYWTHNGPKQINACGFRSSPDSETRAATATADY